MKIKFFRILYFAIFILLFQSCDEDENQAQLFDPPEIINIDASSYNDWVYFSFETGLVVDVAQADSSMDWDIGFKRNHMITNGGLSGQGAGCAIVDSSETWTNESFELSYGNFQTYLYEDIACLEDDLVIGNIFTYEGCYNPEMHIFENCIKNPALDLWGWFDDNYYFNINNYQFFVRRANGEYVKFWPISYRNANGETGKISIAYKEILIEE